jgi:hypothetical protein
MPDLLGRVFRRAANQSSGRIVPVNRHKSFTTDGRVILQDRRDITKMDR